MPSNMKSDCFTMSLSLHKPFTTYCEASFLNLKFLDRRDEARLQQHYPASSNSVHFTVRDNLLLVHYIANGRNEAMLIDVQSSEIIAKHLPVYLQPQSHPEVDFGIHEILG